MKIRLVVKVLENPSLKTAQSTSTVKNIELDTNNRLTNAVVQACASEHTHMLNKSNIYWKKSIVHAILQIYFIVLWLQYNETELYRKVA